MVLTIGRGPLSRIWPRTENERNRRQGWGRWERREGREGRWALWGGWWWQNWWWRRRRRGAWRGRRQGWRRVRGQWRRRWAVGWRRQHGWESWEVDGQVAAAIATAMTGTHLEAVWHHAQAGAQVPAATVVHTVRRIRPGGAEMPDHGNCRWMWWQGWRRWLQGRVWRQSRWRWWQRRRGRHRRRKGWRWRARWRRLPSVRSQTSASTQTVLHAFDLTARVVAADVPPAVGGANAIPRVLHKRVQCSAGGHGNVPQFGGLVRDHELEAILAALMSCILR